MEYPSSRWLIKRVGGNKLLDLRDELLVMNHEKYVTAIREWNVLSGRDAERQPFCSRGRCQGVIRSMADNSWHIDLIIWLSRKGIDHDAIQAKSLAARVGGFNRSKDTLDHIPLVGIPQHPFHLSGFQPVRAQQQTQSLTVHQGPKRFDAHGDVLHAYRQVKEWRQR